MNSDPGRATGDRAGIAPAFAEASPGVLRQQSAEAVRRLLGGFMAPEAAAVLRAAIEDHGAAGVYQALVAAVLRIVFVLFAEGRGLLPRYDPSRGESFALHDLHQALSPAGSLGSDFGAAWGRVTSLWRRIHEGGAAREGPAIPPAGRKFFAPAMYPFLEATTVRADGSRATEQGSPTTCGPSGRGICAAIPDEAVFGVLDALLSLDGQRLEYADLEVEELGAAYEGLLGLELCIVGAASVTIGPSRTVVSLEALLATPGADRAMALKKAAGVLVGRKAHDVSEATSVDALRSALAGWGAGREAAQVAEGTPFLREGKDRRRSGSHYTPRALTARVVAATLGPIVDGLGPDPSEAAILALRVCDPAMGCGAFLLEACRFLARIDRGATDDGAPKDLRRLGAVAQRCLYGVDKNPVAVELARLSLWLLAGASDAPLTEVDEALRVGDSLVGLSPPSEEPTTRGEVNDLSTIHPFHWSSEFPAIFPPEGRRGFDAVIGNPPWVSYAGRAAQPLAPELRSYYAKHFESFHGYRNLQGLFIERSATLLTEGGRLGLVIPSSMSELAGYAPTRLAHDAMCLPDTDLPDLGDAFAEVFQPCMALCSTRRLNGDPGSPEGRPEGSRWIVERPDLAPDARALLLRLNLPPLPGRLFGERGFQSFGEDTQHVHNAPDEAHTIPLRTGGDIEPFARKAPSQFADPSWFGDRIDRRGEWDRVGVLIRQTAAFPKAVLADGIAFRNSILAGFGSPEYPSAFLVAYLNASLIRWLHYARHRDARQGMPQVKIGHLRAIPAPPSPSVVTALARVGAELSGRNAGIGPEEQAALDQIVEAAFGVREQEVAIVRRWAAIVR